ncbi:MAG TPA: four helix bundle protein [bacterium]|nr:four helix bundle protein [bacterium]
MPVQVRPPAQSGSFYKRAGLKIALENRKWRRMSFPFERLDVYRKSIDVIEKIEDICESLKGKISRSLQDQFSRAAMSIALNIAEGNGKGHKAEKRQFFWIARGSCFECIPIIQILHRKKLLTDIQHSDLFESLEIIAKMLTNLIKSVEKNLEG